MQLGRLCGHPSGFLGGAEQVAQLPLWNTETRQAYRNVFVRAGLTRVLVEELVGLAALERRRTSWQGRIWPRQPLYLLEGTVPAAVGGDL
ncbi:MAG: hypothetical protein ACRDZO_10245 [Egibacteraceae bacterium]